MTSKAPICCEKKTGHLPREHATAGAYDTGQEAIDNHITQYSFATTTAAAAAAVTLLMHCHVSNDLKCACVCVCI
jgi:hypothetical protein